MNLERMRKAKANLRDRTKDIRKRHKARYSGKLKVIDWTEVSAGFLEKVQKGTQEWEHMRDVISRNGNDRERRALVKKLSFEIGELYARYRRAAERREGKVGTFSLLSSELIFAKKIAENCLMRDVHPVELLEHWDKRIGDFTDLRYPTLAFLKSPTAVDALALAKKCKFTKRLNEKKPAAGNSFSDLEGLDPKLRPALERAGFATQRYNDRFLLTVQYMATTLASGKKFFIPPGHQRDMAEFAAKNLYSR